MVVLPRFHFHLHSFTAALCARAALLSRFGLPGSSAKPILLLLLTSASEIAKGTYRLRMNLLWPPCLPICDSFVFTHSQSLRAIPKPTSSTRRSQLTRSWTPPPRPEDTLVICTYPLLCFYSGDKRRKYFAILVFLLYICPAYYPLIPLTLRLCNQYVKASNI